MPYWLFLLLGLFLIQTFSRVEVDYLRGVPRLDNNSYWDYYFLCNAMGQTLQWDVNGYGLGGFQGGHVARVLSNNQFNNIFNFQYLATLLSSAATTGGLYTFDSILIVSVQEDSYLNVTCSNGPTSNSITNSEEQPGITDQDRRSNVNVMLERVLTQVIVNGTSTITPTSIFICGVNNEFMNWETNSSNYGFSTFDQAGSRRQNLGAGETTVSQQAVLLSTGPYMLVSVFFATADLDISVTCGYPQSYEHLTNSYFFSGTTSASTSEGVVIASEHKPEATLGGSVMDTTTDELLLKTQNSTTFVATITVIAVVCCLVIVVIIILCLVYFIYRKKKTRDLKAKKMKMRIAPMQAHVRPSVNGEHFSGLASTKSTTLSTAA